jgi:hypothetical protein
MPARFYNISKKEMHAFLSHKGFVPVQVEGTVELVYEKTVRHQDNDVIIHVLTGINPSGESRGCGQDAIRIKLHVKYDGKLCLVGRVQKVKRIESWRKNLGKALSNWWTNWRNCVACGNALVLINGQFGPFWGCVTHKKTGCDGRTVRPKEEPKQPVQQDNQKPYWRNLLNKVG